MRLSPQPSVVCDWKHLCVMRLNPQPSVVCDWKHLRVVRLNPQPSVIWLETLTCNETKSSAFRGLWLETLTSNETKSSVFRGMWLEALTRRLNPQPSVVCDWEQLCIMRQSSAFRGLLLETLSCNETKSSAFHGLCNWKHFRVMRLNPQPSVICNWKHVYWE